MLKITRTLAAVALLALPSLARGQQTEDFKWSDRIDAGHTVKASNVNGRITVRQGTSDRVEVTAVKSWRKSDPKTLRVEARKDGSGDVRICVLYDDQQDCDDRHRDRGWRSGRQDDDLKIDFTILVPKGVRVNAATVNGAVSISGANADIEAATVNGDVDVESGTGRLSASTVNGNVTARIADNASRSMDFTTVNGSVTAELAPNVGADIDMTTVNGDLRSDYDITVRGRIDPRNLSLHVGPSGGPRIRLTTVNGGVQLRKR